MPTERLTDALVDTLQEVFEMAMTQAWDAVRKDGQLAGWEIRELQDTWGMGMMGGPEEAVKATLEQLAEFAAD